jgi:hypothetical protein
LRRLTVFVELVLTIFIIVLTLATGVLVISHGGLSTDAIEALALLAASFIALFFTHRLDNRR